MKTRPTTHLGTIYRHLEPKFGDGQRGTDTNTGEQARAEAGNGPVLKRPCAATEAEIPGHLARGYELK